MSGKLKLGLESGNCAWKAGIWLGKLELGVGWNWVWTAGIGRGKLELGEFKLRKLEDPGKLRI